jgi:hypothetical protein
MNFSQLFVFFSKLIIKRQRSNFALLLFRLLRKIDYVA